MLVRSRSVTVFVSALLALFAASARAQSASPRAMFAGKLAACRVDGLDEPVLCGQHDVYENRAPAAGRAIALTIVVLPATTDSVANDPLVFLAGGGVVPATRYARYLGTSMPALRRHRDILLVDQRGTGGSNPLTCDRARMDTATYQRRYPTPVRTVVMHGVVPLDAPMQVDLARSAQETLDRVLDLCAADSDCRAAFLSCDRISRACSHASTQQARQPRQRSGETSVGRFETRSTRR